MSKRVSERAQRSAQAKQVVRSKRTSERMSVVSERTNGRASDPVLQSVFLVILAHSALYRLLWLSWSSSSFSSSLSSSSPSSYSPSRRRFRAPPPSSLTYSSILFSSGSVLRLTPSSAHHCAPFSLGHPLQYFFSIDHSALLQ